VSDNVEKRFEPDIMIYTYTNNSTIISQIVTLSVIICEIIVLLLVMAQETL